MRGYFTFNGTRSSAHGVYISGGGTFGAPQRMYDVRTIPGRSGSLIMDNKRLEDIFVTYPAFIYTDFKNQVDNLRNWLLAEENIGWQKLSDSYHPGEYRMALYEGAFTPEPTPKMDAGSFDITFRCQPQRWLESGASYIIIESGMTVTNPTNFDAYPIFIVKGTGEIGVGDEVITITNNIESGTFIDCQTMDAYTHTGTNKNQYVSVSGLDFPKLPPGDTTLTLGEGITAARIMPRWYKL